MVSAANKPITVTLIAGSSYSDREAWICNQISQLPARKIGVLLEGLPQGDFALEPNQNLILERLASGCFCCVGNLVVRVVLNRLIRSKISHIFIGLSQTEHLMSFKTFLQDPSYQELIQFESEHILCS